VLERPAGEFLAGLFDKGMKETLFMVALEMS